MWASGALDAVSGSTLLDMDILSLRSEPLEKAAATYPYWSRMVSWVFVPVASVQGYL